MTGAQTIWPKKARGTVEMSRIVDTMEGGDDAGRLV